MGNTASTAQLNTLPQLKQAEEETDLHESTLEGYATGWRPIDFDADAHEFSLATFQAGCYLGDEEDDKDQDDQPSDRTGSLSGESSIKQNEQTAETVVKSSPVGLGDEIKRAHAEPEAPLPKQLSCR